MVVLGTAPALRICRIALSVQDSARVRRPFAERRAPDNALGGAVAKRNGFRQPALFNNSYFRSIDALVLLAAFRL